MWSLRQMFEENIENVNDGVELEIMIALFYFAIFS